MAIYYDKNAPKGDVMLAGYRFTDGRTGDIHPSKAQLRLFKAWGITEVQPTTEPEPVESVPAEPGDEPEPAPEKPSKKRK